MPLNPLSARTNAENAAGGSGLTTPLYRRLRDAALLLPAASASAAEPPRLLDRMNR